MILYNQSIDLVAHFFSHQAKKTKKGRSYTFDLVTTPNQNLNNAGGNYRGLRVVKSLNGGGGGIQGGATAFASPAAFPHYALQQSLGFPYNVYGYVLVPPFLFFSFFFSFCKNQPFLFFMSIEHKLVWFLFEA